jgi:hypothetical protein
MSRVDAAQKWKSEQEAGHENLRPSSAPEDVSVEIPAYLRALVDGPPAILQTYDLAVLTVPLLSIDLQTATRPETLETVQEPEAPAEQSTAIEEQGSQPDLTEETVPDSVAESETEADAVQEEPLEPEVAAGEPEKPREEAAAPAGGAADTREEVREPKPADKGAAQPVSEVAEALDTVPTEATAGVPEAAESAEPEAPSESIEAVETEAETETQIEAEASDIAPPADPDSMDDFVGQVQARAQSIPQPRISGGGTGAVRSGAQQRAEEIHFTEPAVVASAEAQLPPTPENMPVPAQPTEENPVPTATQRVEDTSGKLLPSQSFAALEATPLLNTPRLGARPIPPDRLREAHHVLDDGNLVSMENDPRQPLLDLREALLNPPAVTGQESGVTTLAPHPPRPVPTPTRNARTQLPQLFARLLARPEVEAGKMLTEARKIGFRAGADELEKRGFGNDPHLADLSRELTTQYRDIAAQAGVAAADLDQAIAARQLVLEEEERAARETLAMTSGDASLLVCEAHADLSSTVNTEAARINATADAVAAQSYGGSYADHIHAQRDSLIRRVTRRAGEIDAAYRRAQEDRIKELDSAQTQRLDAYRAAAQMDEFQLNEMAWLPADRQTRFRQIYTDKVGQVPSEESGLTQIEINALASVCTRWADDRAVAVRREVRGFKETVSNSTGAWRTATMEAAESARNEIRTWDETESGETRGWFEKLLDWVSDWIDQAHANADAWQAQQNQQHATEVVTDLNLIDRLNQVADRGVTEEQKRELESLTGDQRKIVQKFFEARSRGEAVDPIELVAELTQARIWAERRPNVIQRLEDAFLADNTMPYDLIDRVVGRGVTGLTGNLYAAFHGSGYFGPFSEAGTDEDAVYAALDSLNRIQSIAIRNIYRRRYGVTLESELKDEMSGGELDRANALLSGNRAEAAAATLYSAMHETFLGTGAGTDEDTVHATLRNLSAEDRAEVVRIYKEKYGLDLMADTKAELNDWATTEGVGTLEVERAEAEFAGDLEKADSLEIRQELKESWFHTSTTSTVASVYERVHREVQQQAFRENRDSAWMEAEILRRTQGIERKYNERDPDSTLAADIAAGTRAEAAFWGSTPDNRQASQDYLQALSQYDMASADAARIRIERTSLLYASDSVITGTLSSQYDRALVQQRLDYAPERRQALIAALNERERASGRAMTPAERWAAMQEIDRQVERELIGRARTVATANLERMEGQYSTKYGESARTAVLESTSFTDNDMAGAMLDQGGYLTPYQTFDFATRRLNTDEDAAKKAFAGLTEEEIAVYDAQWQREHDGQTLRQKASSEMSGRDLLDVDISLDGAPKTIEDQIAQMRKRVAFERPTNALGGMIAVTEREVMEGHLAYLESMAQRMHAPPEGSTLEEQIKARDRILDEFDAQNALVTEAIAHHRKRTDALVDAITTAVGIVVAVVVGVVGSFFTGGAAGAVALAVIASLLSTAATIATRAVLKGNAYGWEDFAVDVGVGLVDAVVAALTAGMGDKLLGLARPAGQQVVRSATATGLRGAWQRVVLSLNRSAARMGETGLLTRATKPIPILQRMAAREASVLSRGAANVMAQSAENFIQSLPSTALSVALDDNTWKGPGNPVLNFLSGTAQALGPGMVMGLAMSGAHSAAGKVRGIFAGPRLGAGTHLRFPEIPLRGTPEYHARFTEWQATHPGRPEAEFQTHVQREFETAVRAAEAQQAVRRDVATQLEEALPPADRGIAAEIPVTVVSGLEFRSVNNWRAGDATVVVRDGQVHIVVREGAPPHAVRAQLEAHVERLRNLVEPGTGGRVRDPRGALPRDLRGRITVDIDADLPPRTVRVVTDPVPRIVAGPGARAADIRLHVQTARNVLQLHGAYGRVRHLLDRFADWAFLHGEPPAGTRAWEARQELRKLPDVIEARMHESVNPDLTAHQRAEIEADIAHLREQVAAHRAALAEMDLNPGRGFIAAEGRTIPTRAELEAAHQSWVDQMRAAIRGEGPPPPPWRGPEPQLDRNGSWRGHNPAEAYAAYRAALREGGGKYEAIITRDRVTGEYQVMLGRQGSVSPPAATTGRSWETVMHYHPNLEGALRYTLPAQQDLWQAMISRFAEGHPPGTPHVEFVESMINGERTRVAIVVDQNGMHLEIGRHAAGTAGPVAVTEKVPINSLEDYLKWWKSQDAGTPLPKPSEPSDTRWVAPGSQEHRDLMHAASEELGHADVTKRIEAESPERAGVPAEPRTMAGEAANKPVDLTPQREARKALEKRVDLLEEERVAARELDRKIQEAHDEMKQSVDDANAASKAGDRAGYTENIQKAKKARQTMEELKEQATEVRTVSGIEAEIKKLNDEIEKIDVVLDPAKYRGLLPCFAAGTLVHTVNGAVPIEQLTCGDIVFSYDLAQRALVHSRIDAVLVSKTARFYEITAGGATIHATGRHPFWVDNESDWIVAGNLKPGMLLHRMDGGAVKVESVAAGQDLAAETYNLSIERTHNYFVGDGVLVHNQDVVDIKLGGDFVIYRGTNPDPKWAGKVYIGQTTMHDEKGKPRGPQERQGEHRGDAEKEYQRLSELSELQKSGKTLTDQELKDLRNLEFYDFMRGVELKEIVVGIKTQAQADYLEQLNMNVERRLDSKSLMNRREEIASESHMNEVVAEIVNDPQVKASPFCKG